MGATRNTGYLENIIAYDASNNVAIATSVNPSYKVTLGGSLSGTSATFSGVGTFNANNGAISVSGTGYTLNPTNMLIGRYTSTRGYVQVPTNGNFEVWDGGTSTIAVFSETNKTTTLYGALNGTSATFSSSVTAGQGIFSVAQATSSVVHKITSGSINDTIITDFQSSGGVTYAYLQTKILDNNTVVKHRGELSFFVRKDNASYSQALTIVDTGAATFSSSATVAGAFISSGTTPYWYLQSSGAGGSTAYLGFGASLTTGAASTDFIIRSENALAFNTNGNNERMRITSGGDVAIGVTSASYKLHIKAASGSTTGIRLESSGGTSNFDLLSSEGDGNAYLYLRSNYNMIFGTNNTERMRITSGGQIYLSRTTGSTDVVNIECLSGFSGRGILLNMDAGSDAITIGGAGTQNAINVTSSGKKVIISNLGGTGNRAVYSDANGTLTNSSSDFTLKTNIEDIAYGLNTVLTLKPISYNWIPEKLGTQKEIGFIAQEVQQLIPEVIGINSDETLSLDYPKLTAVLVKAIQEQQAQIEELKSKLN